MSKNISAEFPFKSNYVEVNGSKMHYVDEGSGIHYIQEDNPHKIGDELSAWYTSL